MLAGKALRKGTRLGVHHIVHIALAIEGHLLGAVPGHGLKAHLLKQRTQFLRLRMSILHKFKAVRAGGIVLADGCPWGIMRKGAHVL